MKYSTDEIEWFLALGKPREEFFLHWDGRDSFFDPGVQAVLERLHPSKVPYPDTVSKDAPVTLWSMADSFEQSRTGETWIELFAFAEKNLLLITDLLGALVRYRNAQAEQRRLWQHLKGKTQRTGDRIVLVDLSRTDRIETLAKLDTIAAVQFWRRDRYLWETDGTTVSHEDAVKANVLMRSAMAEVAKLPKCKRELLGADPLPAVEHVQPPQQWMQDAQHLWSNGATRTAICKENARRDTIMKHWAECWLDYLCGTGVTKSAAKK